MLKRILPCIAAVVIFPSLSFSEGGGNEDWAEKAAVQYEQKAAKAAAEGNGVDAAIYLKMAQMKRDAGAAAKAGKEYSWDAYHALNAQLGGADKHASGKSDYKQGGGKEQPKDSQANAGKKDKGNPGDGFIKTAMQYQEKSIAAIEAGDPVKAGIYSKLAKMKMEAAAAANEGSGYDWTEYHELLKRLE